MWLSSHICQYAYIPLICLVKLLYSDISISTGIRVSEDSFIKLLVSISSSFKQVAFIIHIEAGLQHGCHALDLQEIPLSVSMVSPLRQRVTAMLHAWYL